ncbi:MAG: hypothetical protein GAK31_00045 [Stenotrophomonas maltophilia]|uniref:DUF4124 domain-containing protein n=1 Tax=Stenotrophomonas maltophilia TaxID=40324 RepID=A0A7V8FIT9_STEMA|nr:MAG: hypothetical protein GAK31_00045 [Stenotrophomonas maltophilia]
MKVRWMGAALWLMMLESSAQSRVYKCVDGAAAVYQQMPCPGQAEWRWEIPAEPPRPKVKTAPVPARPPAYRRSPRTALHRSLPEAAAGVRGAVIGWAREPRRCDEARRWRAQQLGSSTRLDYLQQRQLDDAVHAACR